MLEYLLAMHPQHGPAIERALHQLVSKRVISSLAPIFLAETLEPALRDRVRAVFGTIIGPVPTGTAVPQAAPSGPPLATPTPILLPPPPPPQVAPAAAGPFSGLSAPPLVAPPPPLPSGPTEAALPVVPAVPAVLAVPVAPSAPAPAAGLTEATAVVEADGTAATSGVDAKVGSAPKPSVLTTAALVAPTPTLPRPQQRLRMCRARMPLAFFLF